MLQYCSKSILLDMIAESRLQHIMTQIADNMISENIRICGVIDS